MLLLALGCLLIGCGAKNRPDGVLNEDKMVAILIDIHLTEGFVQALPIPYDSSKRLYPILEKEIFEKHAVSDSVYLQSLQFYLRDAIKMEELYARTIDSLTVIEKRVEQPAQR
ncbi:DUF4296 domain-containing protein [Pleomorphovibrio marinus]|uniref:DUF4296 domain-containing protein n=1 Tax=Pleomorphovibrio marinus TaxID=2164132 RepID=UPI000E0BB3DA|nr:DUF4296 domain-containing protein [Pleomorphovibrio marinus]